MRHCVVHDMVVVLVVVMGPTPGRGRGVGGGPWSRSVSGSGKGSGGVVGSRPFLREDVHERVVFTSPLQSQADPRMIWPLTRESIHPRCERRPHEGHQL